MIELKITADTISMLHMDLIELLGGISTGSVQKDIVPATGISPRETGGTDASPNSPADTPKPAEPMQSSVSTPNAPSTNAEPVSSPTPRPEVSAAATVGSDLSAGSSESTPQNTPMASTEPPSALSSESMEPVKRGRGRPRKDAAPAATETASNTISDVPTEADRGNALEDAGNAPTPAPQGGAPEVHQEPATDAREADTPATENASASSSGGEFAPVTDADLQRYCARLAQHYGSPAKVFDLASTYVPEGQPSRPSSIQGDEQRWKFIAAAEADSGLKYHG